jgi:hypothetical protein
MSAFNANPPMPTYKPLYFLFPENSGSGFSLSYSGIGSPSRKEAFDVYASSVNLTAIPSRTALYLIF